MSAKLITRIACDAPRCRATYEGPGTSVGFNRQGAAEAGWMSLDKTDLPGLSFRSKLDLCPTHAPRWREVFLLDTFNSGSDDD